ncbi:ABC transporter permease [Azospirillum brasilense]|uniref:ABC transporter permease n=1 Tax=Azospirillum brasilense TaxID=192 RepID=A0A0P0ERK4_AZOBR|nr:MULTISPECIES: ABC transporter permease [Azospirillum]ALJ37063.1 ABC transporter permease [Azospirillum brasilense]MDW7551757.1 ABC transporter permease [Azospirillum brasilense]MDW7591192.1 ABC transporter permease [Azospirillum brasilense]MDW7626362.1 ABC transporter permease [Azospirillum brasilense]MDX5951289.1 ABC transporter permease [Azospirillum brasilense]
MTGLSLAPQGRRVPPVRPEYERTVATTGPIGDVARPLSLWERIGNITALRRFAVLAAVALLWQIAATWQNNPLMFPTFTATVAALWEAVWRENLLSMAWVSLSVLLKGYAIAVVLAILLTSFAVSTRVGNDVLSTLTSMFNPLPAIALLPIAMLWFGLGAVSLTFVLVHAVLWPLALNTHAGFTSVSETLRMAGRNYGLSGIRYVVAMLIPAAFPAILTGLKVGWAFAWRTLIAAELVFGVSSGKGGLGWFIFQNRNELYIDKVFAGLVTVILIGLVVENVVFRWIEAHTVRKWGMVR